MANIKQRKAVRGKKKPIKPPIAKEITLKFAKGRFAKPPAAKEPKAPVPTGQFHTTDQVKQALSGIPLARLREFIMGGGVPIQQQTTMRAFSQDIKDRERREAQERDQKRNQDLQDMLQSQMQSQVGMMNDTHSRLQHTKEQLEGRLDAVRDVAEHTRTEAEKTTTSQINFGHDANRMSTMFGRQLDRTNRKLAGIEASIAELTGGMIPSTMQQQTAITPARPPARPSSHPSPRPSSQSQLQQQEQQPNMMQYLQQQNIAQQQHRHASTNLARFIPPTPYDSSVEHIPPPLSSSRLQRRPSTAMPSQQSDEIQPTPPKFQRVYPAKPVSKIEQDATESPSIANITSLASLHQQSDTHPVPVLERSYTPTDQASLSGLPPIIPGHHLTGIVPQKEKEKEKDTSLAIHQAVVQHNIKSIGKQRGASVAKQEYVLTNIKQAIALRLTSNPDEIMASEDIVKMINEGFDARMPRGGSRVGSGRPRKNKEAAAPHADSFDEQDLTSE